MVPATIGRRVALNEHRNVVCDGVYIDRWVSAEVAVSPSHP